VSFPCSGASRNDFCCYFGHFLYNIRMPMQARHNQDPLVDELESATAQLETLLRLYQSNEDPLKLVEQLQAVISALKKIRLEVVSKELTTVLNNEALPAATRKATGAKLFQLMVRQKG
jgi:DNA-binding FrmR family transcriptional regulator